MLNSDGINFERLKTDDIPLLHRWLNEPHVHAWYDKNEDNTLERVSEEFGKKISGEEKINSYIVSYQKKDVAYIQSYKAEDWPEFSSFTGYYKHAAGIDVFIGDVEFMGIGFGSLMIKKFLNDVLFRDPDIDVCFIDPEPDNTRAIKSYEKVGFKHTKTIQLPEEPDPSYLMEIKKSL